eukprot:gene18570-25079_t
MAIRTFLLSAEFQAAMQLMVGAFVASLFVFVGPMAFKGSCLAMTLFIIMSLVVPAHCHVGTKLLTSCVMLGSTAVGSALAGAVASVVKACTFSPYGPQPDTASYTALLMVLASAGLALLCINWVAAGPPFLHGIGIQSCLIFGIVIISAQNAAPSDQEDPILWMWEEVVGYTILSTAVAAGCCVASSLLVLPTCAVHELRWKLVDVLVHVGQDVSSYSSEIFDPINGAGVGVESPTKSRVKAAGNIGRAEGAASARSEVCGRDGVVEKVATDSVEGSEDEHEFDYLGREMNVQMFIRMIRQATAPVDNVKSGGGWHRGHTSRKVLSRFTNSLSSFSTSKPVKHTHSQADKALPKDSPSTIPSSLHARPPSSTGIVHLPPYSHATRGLPPSSKGAAKLPQNNPDTSQAEQHTHDTRSSRNVSYDIRQAAARHCTGLETGGQKETPLKAPGSPFALNLCHQLLNQARDLIPFATIEPFFMTGYHFRPADWGKVVVATKKLLTSVANLQTIMEEKEKMRGNRSIECYMGRNFLPIFRLAYAQISLTCIALSDALSDDVRPRGFWQRLQRQYIQPFGRGSAANNNNSNNNNSNSKSQTKPMPDTKARGGWDIGSGEGGNSHGQLPFRRGSVAGKSRPKFTPNAQAGGGRDTDNEEGGGRDGQPLKSTPNSQAGGGWDIGSGEGGDSHGQHRNWGSVKKSLSVRLQQGLHDYWHRARQGHPQKAKVDLMDTQSLRALMFTLTLSHGICDAMEELGSAVEAALRRNEPRCEACKTAPARAEAASPEGAEVVIQLALTPPDKRGPGGAVQGVDGVEQLGKRNAEGAGQKGAAVGAVATQTKDTVDTPTTKNASAGPPEDAVVTPTTKNATAGPPEDAVVTSTNKSSFISSSVRFFDSASWPYPGRWLVTSASLLLGVPALLGILNELFVEVPRVLQSEAGVKGLLRSRKFQAGVKYFCSLNVVLMLVVGLSSKDDRVGEDVRRYLPVNAYVACAIATSQRVEATWSGVIQWLVGSALGGTLGMLCMLHNGLATNPYALMALICAFTFLVGTQAKEAHKKVVALTLLSFTAVILCQYKLDCDESGDSCSGSMAFYATRVLSILIGIIVAFVVGNLVLPWYTSDWALEVMGSAFEDSVDVALVSFGKFIRGGAAALEACIVKGGGGAQAMFPDVGRGQAMSSDTGQSQAMFSDTGRGQAKQPPSPFDAAAADGDAVQASTADGTPHSHNGQRGRNPHPETSLNGSPLAAAFERMSRASYGRISEKLFAFCASKDTSVSRGGSLRRSLEKTSSIPLFPSFHETLKNRGVALLEPSPELEDLQFKVAASLTRVQASLAMDSTFWKKGVMATPPILYQLLQQEFNLLDRLSTLLLTLQGPLVTGDFTGWSFRGIVQPLQADHAAVLHSTATMANIVAAILRGDLTAETNMRLTESVRVLEQHRVTVYSHHQKIRKEFIIKACRATADQLKYMIHPDDTVRVYSFFFSISKFVDKATQIAQMVETMSAPKTLPR